MSEQVELQPRLLYPFRRRELPGPADAAAAVLVAAGARAFRGSGLLTPERVVERVAARSRACRELSAAALRETAKTRPRSGRDGKVLSLALAGEAFRRNCGFEVSDAQWLAAWDMMHGRLASLGAGAGKSGAAAIAAAAMALAGTPVHVVVASDRRAARDHRRFAALYHELGLGVGVSAEGMEPEVRRAAYRCDVAYVAARQAVADHLSDRFVMRDRGGNLRLKVGQLHTGAPVLPALMMRGLHAAIVDDADAVLVDGARNPVILSGPVRGALETRVAADALRVARGLAEGRDFAGLRDGAREIALTDAGRERVARLTAGMRGLWRGAARRERFACAALAALHAMQRDREYACDEGQVRPAPAMAQHPLALKYWSCGLLQMIEIKEGLPGNAINVPLAQLTVPGFFRRYRLVGAITAVPRPIARELERSYGLAWFGGSGRSACRRPAVRWRVCRDGAEKWRMLAARARAHLDAGRPVLIGAPAEGIAADAAAALDAAGILHGVLDGGRDGEDGAVPAQAIAPGSVAIVVGDALRGETPHVPEAVRACGGPAVLLVAACEAHHRDALLLSLAGCDPTGSPSAEYVLSLDERDVAEGPYGRLAHLFRRLPAPAAAICGRALFTAVRLSRSRAQARIRRGVVEADRRRRRLLAFTGAPE